MIARNIKKLTIARLSLWLTGLVLLAFCMAASSFVMFRTLQTPAPAAQSAAALPEPVFLPSFLSQDEDSDLYRHIFAAQESGRWQEADALSAQLSDKLLLGHVLAERYLDTRYKANYAELASWLEQYHDLPQARAIYALARAKRSGNEILPASPKRIASVRRGPDGSAPSVLRANGAAHAEWQTALETYRRGDYDTATAQFAGLLDQDLPAADRSAAAFWAWRAAKAAGQDATAATYLATAAEAPRSFYGIIACQALKRDLDISRDELVLNRAEREILLTIPALKRAALLVKTGKTELAEREIETSFAQTQDGNILKLAGEWNMASLQMRLGSALPKDDAARDVALYPTPDWQPETGYAVDPALLYAITRQESKFDERATSGSGAMGLMQLMPKTAHYMARKARPGINTAELRHQLYEPETNITLGQNYIRHLMDQGYVGKNLVFLVAAYNAGPGKLLEWKGSLDYRHDPLLFIEMIPSAQTRNYVQNVMANYWIYSSLRGAALSSAKALLSGRWPSYQTMGREFADLPRAK